MISKTNVRWYVDPYRTPSMGYMLCQTNSAFPVAYVANEDEAKWICNKLNSGRELCVAVSNLLEHSTWAKGEAASLIDDTLQALMRYKREV